jgi:hypothetical protein
MGEEAYTPGSPEVELAREGGQPIKLEEERGKLGWVMLTNDRVLFTHQKFGSSPGGGAIAGGVAAALQKRSEKKAGGPRELFQLSEVGSGEPVKRRLLPDMFQFNLTDGLTCRLSDGLGEKWGPMIRRLLVERHGLIVADDGAGGWAVSPGL